MPWMDMGHGPFGGHLLRLSGFFGGWLGGGLAGGAGATLSGAAGPSQLMAMNGTASTQPASRTTRMEAARFICYLADGFTPNHTPLLTLWQRLGDDVERPEQQGNPRR